MLMKKAHDHYSTDTQVPETFEAWREKREKDYPQFRFWSITLNLQLLMLLFVRAIRSADFQLYKAFINGLLPWFFAMDHVNYARWLSVHLCDMLQLEDTNPDIFSHFNDGEFVITKREFSSIGIDHAHEQNNKCVWRFVNSVLINLPISQKKIIYIVCYFNSALITVFLGKQDGQHFIYNHNYFSSVLEVLTYVEILKN